jgi:regulator of protease activity HflC (stomatin/prohibitin superfamily)
LTQRTKAAWVALTLITVLTVVKFVLYGLSGSISVLSEAWHSFTDIATTLLVLVSIIRQERKARRQQNTDVPFPPDQERKQPDGLLIRCYRWFRSVNTELKISFVIGIVLFSAAAAILFRAIASETVVISNPLLTGVIFIGLSFGSYFLYRFEKNIARHEKSAALAADSHHNQADMATSLITGISLILYHYGTNTDRWVGIFIAAYILTFSTELLVNTIRSVYRNQQDFIIEYRFTSILWRLFQVQTYRSLFTMVDAHLKVGERGKSVLQMIPKLIRWTFLWALRLAGVIAVAVYISTMFYTVKPDEKALLFRFGKIVRVNGPILPGMHWKLPYPIDTVDRFQTEKIQAIAVGNASGNVPAMIWTIEHGDNQTFISGDDNLFLPYIVIHYKIKNLGDYYLTHRSDTPEKILISSSYRLLSRTFAGMSFYDLILSVREQWTVSCKELLQKELDRLRTGLEIVDFCLKDLHPPIALAGSYEDVVAAHQIRETYLNDAERQVNDLLSQERIKAMKSVSDAKSYVIEKENLAKGEAKNYLLRYSGYRAGGKIMKNLLLLKTAEKTLSGKKIYIVDPNSGIDEKLLYIENYMTSGKNP